MAEFDFLEQGLGQKADADRRTNLPICRPFVHLPREKLGRIEHESITEFAWNSRLHLDYVPRTSGISCFDVDDRQLVILDHLVVVRIQDFHFLDRVLRLEHCVEKMNQQVRVLQTSKEKFENEVDSWADS